MRQLTYKTDICDAFAGILRALCKDDSPYHGIPLSIFEHALCWSESADAERLRPGSSCLPRSLAVSLQPASVAEVRARNGRSDFVIAEGTGHNGNGADREQVSIARNQAFPTWAWAYWSSPVTYRDSSCNGLLGLFDFEQISAELIVGVPRKTPSFFKRLGHGDRGNGPFCGQPVEIQPVPDDWTWFPGGVAPQPRDIPTTNYGRPTTLMLWTQCIPYSFRRDVGFPRYETLISAWKGTPGPCKIVMILEERGNCYVRVGLEHRPYLSYQKLEEESKGQPWQWVAIR